MAVFGHSGSQAPQLMHSSVIIVDISRGPYNGSPLMTTCAPRSGGGAGHGDARGAADRVGDARREGAEGGAGGVGRVGEDDRTSPVAAVADGGRDRDARQERDAGALGEPV